MKEEVFNQYADRVAKIFGISKEKLFSYTKKREVVDARQLLTYLCYNRQMKLVTIENFMENNGYKTNHNTIAHSIKIINQKITEDRDYKTIISNIENSVFI
jgi:chromosomal replication initiation ATPase DnaA